MQRNVPVYVALVEALRARIISGEWTADLRLPSIQQLSQEFHVATGSLREALRVLESEGLVRIEHGRGMFVTEQPQLQSDPYQYFQRAEHSSVLELFEARRILEPELAALAAERGSETELRLVVETSKEMEHLVMVEEDFLETDLQFHRQIAVAAHNRVLASMLDGVNDLLLEGRRLTAGQPETVARAVRYHLLIAESIQNRNSLQARLLMLAHVNDAIDAVVALQQGDSNQPVRSGTAPALSALIVAQRAILPNA